MNLAPPIPRLGLPGRERELTPAEQRKTANRQPARTRTGSVLQRERHQADYVILVVVVALTAIGILMVYSSSAIRGYLSNEDTFATVGPQIQWAVLGILAMVVMMRVDYRYLRLVSVPFYIVAVGLLLLVFVPAVQPRRRRLGALARARRCCRRSTRPRSRSWRWSSTSPTGSPSAATKVRSFWGGTVPFLIIVAPVLVLVFKEPDLGTTMVIGADRVHDVLRGRRQPRPPRGDGRRGAPGRDLRRPARLPDGADPHLARPLVRPARRRASTRSRACSRSASAGCSGPASGQSVVSVPNAFNDFIFAEIGQEFGLLGAGIVVRPVPRPRVLGDARRAGGA